jgi:hypothetical protein
MNNLYLKVITINYPYRNFEFSGALMAGRPRICDGAFLKSTQGQADPKILKRLLMQILVKSQVLLFEGFVMLIPHC